MGGKIVVSVGCIFVISSGSFYHSSVSQLEEYPVLRGTVIKSLYGNVLIQICRFQDNVAVDMDVPRT